MNNDRIDFEQLEREIKIQDQLDKAKFWYDTRKSGIKLIGIFLFLVVSIVMHEFIHAETLRYFGCSQVEYDFGLVSTVECVDEREVYLSQEALAHSMIELAYYMGMFFFVFYWYIKRMFKDIDEE